MDVETLQPVLSRSWSRGPALFPKPSSCSSKAVWHTAPPWGPGCGLWLRTLVPLPAGEQSPCACLAPLALLLLPGGSCQNHPGPGKSLVINLVSNLLIQLLLDLISEKSAPATWSLFHVLCPHRGTGKDSATLSPRARPCTALSCGRGFWVLPRPRPSRLIKVNYFLLITTIMPRSPPFLNPVLVQAASDVCPPVLARGCRGGKLRAGRRTEGARGDRDAPGVDAPQGKTARKRFKTTEGPAPASVSIQTHTLPGLDKSAGDRHLSDLLSQRALCSPHSPDSAFLLIK